MELLPNVLGKDIRCRGGGSGTENASRTQMKEDGVQPTLSETIRDIHPVPIHYAKILSLVVNTGQLVLAYHQVHFLFIPKPNMCFTVKIKFLS